MNGLEAIKSRSEVFFFEAKACFSRVGTACPNGWQGEHAELVGCPLGEQADAAVRGIYGDRGVRDICGDERRGFPQDREKVRQDYGDRLPQQASAEAKKVESETE